VPVLASPNGGMKEMIEDGVSGWIARDATPDGLAIALRRALATTPEERQQMGATAAAAIERMCDSKAVVKQHLELKARLARDSGGRVSSRPVPDRPSSPVEPRAAQAHPFAVVYTNGEGGVERSPFAAAADIVREAPALAGAVVVDPRVCLEAMCLETCDALFARDEGLGVLTSWLHDRGRNRVYVPPNPTDPLSWGTSNAVPFVAVRRDVLLELAPDAHVRSIDDLCAAVWTAATYPGVLASLAEGPVGVIPQPRPLRYSLMARAIQRLHTPLVDLLRAGSVEERWALAVEGLRHPGRALGWLAGRARRAWRRDGGPRQSGYPEPVREVPDGRRRG
jgi:hypothetical protein